MEISTSILNARNREKTILKLNKSKTDYIHFDVMDGEFVDNEQFEIDELIRLLKLSTKIFKDRKKLLCFPCFCLEPAA